MKSAFITGITGQDGSYLVELLLEKGYHIYGLHRRSSTNNFDRIKSILNNENFHLIECEVADASCVYALVDQYQPEEIYNLAAQSHVATSFEQPEYTFQVNTNGPLNFLEAIRRYSPSTKFYQASTSEMFGKNFSHAHGTKCQNETTEFMPQSPYAVAKLAAHNLCRIYREGYDVHASCGILFNHESERRGEQFVTRKITKWLGEFYKWCMNFENQTFTFDDDHVYIGTESFPKLRLGNLEVQRDWGHAKDYVYAMWLMTQKDEPDDYVVATGETYSVREFLDEAFNQVGLDTWERFVVQDPQFYRPAEVEYLLGDALKARQVLGWRPQIRFQGLVQRMVRSDIGGCCKARLGQSSLQIVENCCQEEG